VKNHNGVKNNDILGKLYDHFSISKGNKIYIYGGVFEKNLELIQNKTIYILNIGNGEFLNRSFYLLASLEWEMIEPYSKIHSTFQVHEENIYLFGGAQNDPSSHLSIYNISKTKAFECSEFVKARILSMRSK